MQFRCVGHNPFSTSLGRYPHLPGQVEGGADAVVQAILEVLGPEGTLMVPTFTYSFSSIGQWQPFSYEKTPSRVGIITEAVRQHAGAIRSFHPTHSVAAIGKRAQELTQAHLASSPLGAESPFHRLALWGGDVILLGCDHRANSLIHVAEVLAHLPYVDVAFSVNRSFETAVIYRNGKQVGEIRLFEVPGCSRGFDKAEPVLREAGIIRDGRIGQADIQIFSGKAMLEVLICALKRNPTLLLCDIPDCSICPRRRRAAH